MRLLLLCAALLTAAPAFAVDLPDWLAGHWRTRGGSSTTDEVWLAPADDLMTGMSRTSGGKKPFFEFVRLERRGDAVYYIAQPRGGAATEFKLVHGDAQQFRAENAAHDFPQRVIYERRGDDAIDARIEGTVNGKLRQERWQYFRVR